MTKRGARDSSYGSSIVDVELVVIQPTGTRRQLRSHARKSRKRKISASSKKKENWERGITSAAEAFDAITSNKPLKPPGR